MDRVSLDVDYFACGGTHTVTAWTTATPGLVVWYGDQENLHCWSEDDYHAWSIQQEYTSGPDWAGIEDPDTALYLARRMGRYHDWTRPADGSVWTAAVADLQPRGEVPIGRPAPSRRPKRRPVTHPAPNPRVVHSPVLDDGQAVDDATQPAGVAVTCRACGAVHDGRGSTSVEQIEPVLEAPWRASCWHCGWYQDEHYPEDAEGAADDHGCPACPACGHGR